MASQEDPVANPELEPLQRVILEHGELDWVLLGKVLELVNERRGDPCPTFRTPGVHERSIAEIGSLLRLGLVTVGTYTDAGGYQAWEHASAAVLDRLREGLAQANSRAYDEFVMRTMIDVLPVDRPAGEGGRDSA